MDSHGISSTENGILIDTYSENKIFQSPPLPPLPLGKTSRGVSSTLSSSSQQAHNGVRYTMPDVSEFLKSAPPIRAAKEVLEQRSGDMIEDIFTDSVIGSYGMRSKRKNYSYFAKRLFVSLPNEHFTDKTPHSPVTMQNENKIQKLQDTPFQQNSTMNIKSIDQIVEDGCDDNVEQQQEEDRIRSFGQESQLNVTKEEGGGDSGNKISSKIQKMKMKNKHYYSRNVEEGSSSQIKTPDNMNSYYTQQVNQPNSNNVSAFIPETVRIMNCESPSKTTARQNDGTGGLSSKMNDKQNKDLKSIEEFSILKDGTTSNGNQQHQQMHKSQSQSQNKNKAIIKVQPWKQNMKSLGKIVLVVLLMFALGLISGLLGSFLGNSQDHGWLLCGIFYPVSGILLLCWQFESVRLNLARICVQVAAESAARLTLERELEYASYQKFYSFEHFKRVFRRVCVRTVIICVILSFAAAVLVEKAILTYIKRESADKPKNILLAEIFLRGLWLLPMLGVSYLFLQHERKIVRNLLRIDEGAANLDRNQLTGAFYDQFETEFAVVEARIASGLRTGEQKAADVFARRAARKSGRGAKLQIAVMKSKNSGSNIMDLKAYEQYKKQKEEQLKSSGVLRQSQLGENDSGIITPMTVHKEEKSVIEKRAILRDWVWYWKRITARDISKLVLMHLTTAFLLFSGVLSSLLGASDYILDTNEYGFMVAYGIIFIIGYMAYFFAPCSSANGSINSNGLAANGRVGNGKSSSIQDWSQELLISSSISAGVVSGRLEQSKQSYEIIASVSVIKIAVLLLVFILSLIKRSCETQSIGLSKTPKQQSSSSSQNQITKMSNMLHTVQKLAIAVMMETCGSAGIFGSAITLYGKLDFQFNQLIHQSHDFMKIFMVLAGEILAINIAAFIAMYVLSRAIQKTRSQILKQFSFSQFFQTLLKQHVMLLAFFHLFAWQFIFLIVCN